MENDRGKKYGGAVEEAIDEREEGERKRARIVSNKITASRQG